MVRAGDESGVEARTEGFELFIPGVHGSAIGDLSFVTFAAEADGADREDRGGFRGKRWGCRCRSRSGCGGFFGRG